MFTRLNRHRGLRAATALGAVTLLGISCGGDDGSSAAAPVEDPESPYCDTARKWAVYALDGTGDNQPDPASLKSYWAQYTEFINTAAPQAPATIATAWGINHKAIATTLTPLMEKYDFDVARMESEGSEAERAVFEKPPADVQAAQATIHTYESRVCGTAPGEAAEVAFTGDGSEGEYCEAAGAFDAEFGKVIESGFEPAALRAFIEGQAFTTGLDTMAKKAPDDIKADAKALTDWFGGPAAKALASFDYDVRRLLLEGSAKDRAAFQQTDPAIAEHHGRVLAYDEQVCGL